MTFEDVYRHVAIANAGLVDHVRARNIWHHAVTRRDLAGEFWECGVYRGGMSYVLHQAIRATRPRMQRMFDSFEGLPEPTDKDLHEKGEFASTLEETFALFGQDQPTPWAIKGWIPDTFAGFEDARIALAHIDLDLYQSTADALDFVWERIVPGGVMILDDYGLHSCLGVSRSRSTNASRTYPKTLPNSY